MKQHAEPSDTLKSKSRFTFSPAVAILVVFAIYFGSQIFAGVILGGLGSLLGNSGQQLVNLLQDSVVWQFGFIALVEAITLGLLWFFMKRLRVSLKTIGLGRRPVSSDVGYGLFTFVVYFMILIAATSAVKQFVPSIDVEQEQQIGFQSATSSLQLLLVFVSLAIMPPIVEEIMVRGFLFSGLRTKLGKLSAALIASGLFAVAHLQLGSGAPPLWIAAIDTFLLSMILIQLRLKTGSLWAGILVHGLKNGLAFLALFVLR